MLDFLTPSAVAVFLVTLLVIWFINTIFQRRHLPPGPFPLPVVGNYLQARQHYSTMYFSEHLRNKYGKICSWKMGGHLVLNLSDIKLIQEAFVHQSDAFSSRPHARLPVGLYTIKHFGYGLSNNDGPQWKELRKITLRAMRDLGVGKKSLEDKIMDEVSIVLDYMSQQNGRPHCCYKALMIKASSNVICNVVFGERFDYEDPRFIHLLGFVGKFFSSSETLVYNRFNFFPYLLPVLMAVKGKGEGYHALNETLKHIKELSKDHEATFDPSNIRDFVDLAIQYKQENRGKHDVSDTNVERVIVDLFVAGSDTTAMALYWALLYMAAYPDVQAKCQKEIDEVVGKGRPVSLSDKAKLKYVEATLLEVRRMGIIAPIGLGHMTSRDTYLAGYFIPKNTIVNTCIGHVCRDPDLWPEPEKFDPLRFLDSENNLVKKELVMNFSMGPRSCVGESLSKMELSLFFPNILQRFDILPGSKDESVDFEAIEGINRQGKEQDLIFRKR